MVALIVAVGKNNVIGKDNKLLWHLPKDLQYFKTLTDGQIIVMGRKTFDSLPRLLPNREHWVLTHDLSYKPKYEGAKIFYHIDDLRKCIDEKEKVFIIGGEQIYRQFLPMAEELYVTEVDAEFEGDAFFPDIDCKLFEKVSVVEGQQDEKHPWSFRFVTYKKCKR